jgi:hypothetical protein
MSSLFTQPPKYGDVISAISLAISRDTAITRLGVVAVQASHMMEERPTAQKRGKGAVRSVSTAGATTQSRTRGTPVAKKEVKKAREVYEYRPLQFDVTQGTRFEEPRPIIHKRQRQRHASDSLAQASPPPS